MNNSALKFFTAICLVAILGACNMSTEGAARSEPGGNGGNAAPQNVDLSAPTAGIPESIQNIPSPIETLTGISNGGGLQPVVQQPICTICN